MGSDYDPSEDLAALRPHGSARLGSGALVATSILLVFSAISMHLQLIYAAPWFVAWVYAKWPMACVAAFAAHRINGYAPSSLPLFTGVSLVLLADAVAYVACLVTFGGMQCYPVLAVFSTTLACVAIPALRRGAREAEAARSRLRHEGLLDA